MASRPLIIASLLGASVGVPYVASRATQGPAKPGATSTPNAIAAPGATTAMVPQITSTSIPTTSAALLSPSPVPAAQPTSLTPPITTAQPIATYPLASPQVRLLPPVTSAAAATYALTPMAPQNGAQFASVSQVLRFDVTKDWVCRTWPRKSTGPTDVGLFAIRVPLVMGTQMSSLVGALTYYFNAQDQVEHISFRGRTGDAIPLVQYLTQTYQFQPVVSPTGEKIFQVASDNGLHSELRLHPEAVLDANLPQQSIVVELELARPGSQRVLPPHGPALQIPQVDNTAAAATPLAQPPSAPTAAAANTAAPTAAATSGGYWNQVRYATQDEQTPMFDRRWPE